MQTKYKLPKDIYQATLWIIRGQNRREEEYKRKKDDILNGGGAKYIEYYNKRSKEYNRAYLPSSHSNQSDVEVKALALEALEENNETKKMKAVQQALDEVCVHIEGSSAKEYFKTALMLNISERKNYPFRNLNNICICEKTFYTYKSKFIYSVAKKINLI